MKLLLILFFKSLAINSPANKENIKFEPTIVSNAYFIEYIPFTVSECVLTRSSASASKQLIR